MARRQPKNHPRKTPVVENRLPWATLVMSAALMIITFVAHMPAVRAGYCWDDDSRVYQNPLLRSAEGLVKCWISTELPDYWPLTRTLFWMEWQLWGSNPAAFHVVSILLQGMAAVLLWRVSRHLGLNEYGAYLTGLLFAVHPVTVESVAWITEQKTVLSMVFYLLSILAFLRFEDRPSLRCYILALLVAMAALLAKSTAAALPIVLLICVWWRRGRVTTVDVIRVVPFLALSVILGLIEFWFESHNAIGNTVVRPEGFASRVASVGWVFWFYLYKIAFPVNLAMVYPRWEIDGGCIHSFVPLTLMIVCFVTLWRFRTSWGKGPLAALASFVIVLSPVLGLLTMSYARHSLVADHLQYPGMPGIMMLIGGSIGTVRAWAQRRNLVGIRIGTTAVAGAITLTCGVLTWQQAGVYLNRVTLWTHTLSINDRAWAAYNDRGFAYADMGETEKAIQDYSRAMVLNPTYAMPYSNRASAYTKLRKYEQAMADCNKAIELDPTLAVAFNNRGNVYAALHDRERAIQDYTQAITLKPDYAEAYNNRGVAYDDLHDSSRAFADYQKALELRPDFAEVYHNLSVYHYVNKEYDRAWADINKCKKLGGTINPNFIKALSKASGRSQ